MPELSTTVIFLIWSCLCVSLGFVLTKVIDRLRVAKLDKKD